MKLPPDATPPPAPPADGERQTHSQGSEPDGQVTSGTVFDLATDLHGRVNEFMMDTDRRWFAEHPGQERYVRAVIEHEWCSPKAALDGYCESMVDAPPGHYVLVEVIQLTTGVRARWPFFVRGIT